MNCATDQTKTFECSHCGCDADSDTGRELSNGNRVCDSCSDDFTACSHCDSDVHSDKTASAEGDADICERCQSRYFTYSDRQRTYVLDSESVRLQDTGDTVSLSWAESHAYSSDDDEWYADEDNVPGRSGVHDYSENVLQYCKYDRKALESGALMFGVELEMEPAESGAQEEVADALGGRTCNQYILKSDGSLDSGVELVTIPLTLDGHRDGFNWARVLKPVQYIAKSGMGTTNCGMHVHINKAALSPLQIGKMLVFLNSPAMRDPITVIAQRESNSYCERSQKKITDGSKCSETRHDIANVGQRTVEIRMFRGNLRAERILKNVEFCHALVTYCRDASLQVVEQWAEFSSWLLVRRSQYPNLVKFLSDRDVPCFTGARRKQKDRVQEAVSCA